MEMVGWGKVIEYCDDDAHTKYTYRDPQGSTAAIYLKGSETYVISRSGQHMDSKKDWDNGKPADNFATLKAAYENRRAKDNKG
jgi:hypothetical protein